MPNNKFKFNIEGIDNELVKKTVLVYIGVIFLLVVSILFLFPRFSDLMLLRKNSEREVDKVKKIKESLAVLDQFEARVGNINLELIKTALPAGFDPGLILSELRKLSNRHGVVITSYLLSGGEVEGGNNNLAKSGKQTGKKINKNQGLQLVAVDLVVSGSAGRLISFMESLEKTLPLLNVAEVEASEVTNVVKEEGGGGEVDLSLKLNYYYFPYQEILEDNLVTLDQYLILPEDLLLLSKFSSYNKATKIPMKGMVNGGNRDFFGAD